MKDFAGRVAVVTGGASGIGRALAQAFAKRSMKIVLADIETAALEATARELRDQGAEVMTAIVDVRDRQAVGKLADDVYARYGAAHVLCNNAGVGKGGFMHELTLEEWDWVLDVNLRGVVYGIHHFLPRMRASAEPGHIVNTASIAGLVATPGMAPYTATKYAVVGISETLAAECLGSNIGVSVLCPAWVPTAIHTSERNRPQRFGEAAPPSAASAAYQERMGQAVKSGRLTADDMANAVFDAVAADRFYVIPHARIKQAVRLRMEDILEERNPTPI